MTTKIARDDLGAGTGKHVKGQDFSGCLLVDAAGRDVKYEQCNFAASVVERGYFFHATFSHCDFTGARFIDCNFRQAAFENCRFDYADFNRCVVPTPQLLANLPAFANVRWELLHNLRANARAVGDSRHDAAIVKKEIEAEIEHWRAVRQRPSGYYQKYDNWRDQSRAWFHSGRLFIERYLWGHGESLLRLSIATSAVLIFLSLAHWISAITPLDTLTWTKLLGEAKTSALFVFQIFIDLPSVSSPQVDNSPFIASCALAVRYLALGLAIPVLYKHISKR